MVFTPPISPISSVPLYPPNPPNFCFLLLKNRCLKLVIIMIVERIIKYNVKLNKPA